MAEEVLWSTSFVEARLEAFVAFLCEIGAVSKRSGRRPLIALL